MYFNQTYWYTCWVMEKDPRGMDSMGFFYQFGCKYIYLNVCHSLKIKVVLYICNAIHKATKKSSFIKYKIGWSGLNTSSVRWDLPLLSDASISRSPKFSVFHCFYNFRCHCHQINVFWYHDWTIACIYIIIISISQKKGAYLAILEWMEPRLNYQYALV